MMESVEIPSAQQCRRMMSAEILCVSGRRYIALEEKRGKAAERARVGRDGWH